MKRFSLLTLILLLFLVSCNFNNGEDINNNKNKTIQTIDYRIVNASEIHPTIDEGYTKVPYIIIGEQLYDSFEDEKTYLYKLSCKNETDSFKNHLFEYADDNCFYAELSEKQNAMLPNGFEILWNSNIKGSAVEIKIDKIYECFSYREIFYSESLKMVKVVYYDHVIPGLEESEVNLLKGVLVDKSPYVEENKLKSGFDRYFPFTTGIEIEYIDVSDYIIQIGK